MNQLFPITDWSLEPMKQALTVIIRRIDKLFSKMHKTVKVSHLYVQIYEIVTAHNKSIIYYNIYIIYTYIGLPSGRLESRCRVAAWNLYNVVETPVYCKYAQLKELDWNMSGICISIYKYLLKCISII